MSHGLFHGASVVTTVTRPLQYFHTMKRLTFENGEVRDATDDEDEEDADAE